MITAAGSNPEPLDGVAFGQPDLTTAEGEETCAKAALDRLVGVDILAHVMGGSNTPGAASSPLQTSTSSPSRVGAFWRPCA